MSTTPIAIVGVGQTRYKRRHSDLDTAELVRQATLAALEDAQLSLADIELIVGGVAPEAGVQALRAVPGVGPAHAAGVLDRQGGRVGIVTALRTTARPSRSGPMG